MKPIKKIGVRSIKNKNIHKLIITKLVLLAVAGIFLSVSLLFLTAWAMQDSGSTGSSIYSDHRTSVKVRLREVLFNDNQVWNSIVNSQLKVNNNKSSNIVALGYVLTGIDLYRPITFLQSQFQWFNTSTVIANPSIEGDIVDDTIYESAGPSIITSGVENGAGQEVDVTTTQTISSDKPLVFIYHTHNTEAYLPDSGVRYQSNGNSATVVQPGILLSKILNDKYEIPVLHSQKNHIWEPFWAAYSHSLQTLEENLKKHKSINYVIDIHNDGVGKELTTIKLNGERYARIYFVVGSDRVRNPKWQKNYNFALRLQHKLEQRYPGLSRGILLQDTARYNQHLVNNSILIEMGGYQNSLAEARRSTEILAELLAEVILEDLSKKT